LRAIVMGSSGCCGDIGHFGRYVGLFCGYTGLFCGCVGLFAVKRLRLSMESLAVVMIWGILAEI